jgi:proline iminopeptidase
MKIFFALGLVTFLTAQDCFCQLAKDSSYYKKITQKGVKFIPVRNGEYKVFTQKVGKGKIKLLLLHGGPMNTHEYFENFPKYLNKEGIQIYYYDQLGTYHSDQPTDTSFWDVEKFVDEVEEVRKGLNLNEFYILGHSWGGMLGELYAAKYRQHLKGIIISNSPAFIRDTAKFNTAFFKDINNFIDRNVKALPEFKSISPQTLDSVSNGIKLSDTVLYASLKKQYSIKVDSFLNRHYHYRGEPQPEPMLRNSKHIDRKRRQELGIYNKICSPDYPAAMEKIRCPVLILGGVYDRMAQEFYPEMKKQFVQTSVRIYLCPNGSHFSMWDDSENYFREVVRFLKDVQSNSFDSDK